MNWIMIYDVINVMLSNIWESDHPNVPKHTHVEGDGTGPAPPSLQSMLAFIDAEESTGGGFFNECWGDLRVQFATHL